jgi:hypothetical protein
MGRKSKAAELYLRTDCVVCGAAEGDPCVSTNRKDGSRSVLSPSRAHKERMQASIWRRKDYPYPVTDPLHVGEPPKHVEVAPVDGSPFFGEGLKKRRVDQVLWAIGFARNIMNVPQSELDRNLAVMIVEAELDLRLF